MKRTGHVLLLILGVISLAHSPVTSYRLDFIPKPELSYYGNAFLRLVHRKPESYNGLVTELQSYLNATLYPKGDTSNVVVCDPMMSGLVSDETVCKFDIRILDPCIYQRGRFGFDTGQPCILLRLENKLDWKPKDNSGVTVECHGKYAPDKDNIGRVVYYPDTRNLPAVYFPWHHQPNYMSPLVAVKFLNLTTGVIVFVECTASDAGGEVGRVNFELLVD